MLLNTNDQISMFPSVAYAVSSEISFIFDRVRRLNVDIIVACLHLRSRFLGSVGDLSNAEARAETKAERTPWLPGR